jgi:hypothetical protein
MRLKQWNRVCTIIDQIGYISRSKKDYIIIDLGDIYSIIENIGTEYAL